MSPNSPGPSRRPRLLVLTPDFPPAPGGIQQVVHRLAAGMSTFQTLVVALDEGFFRAPASLRGDEGATVAVTPADRPPDVCGHVA